MAHPLVPVPTPETQPYWDGVAARELRLPRCRACGEAFFPPTPVCPNCTARDIEWFTASGDATLYSYVISARPSKLWNHEGPMSVALVALAEGPMLVSTIRGCDQTPEALQLDMPLRAAFAPFDEVELLVFEPAEPAGGA
ncbi:MAG: OB-fold domain-containing protein [Acidimicrobiia bacterium]|nr:OB-fold domain-containing protein [Acidimicrobiia bacterium]